ncbi:MAG: hypothetical protein H7101_02885 [Deinococcales bacterium]|nr:hypothetical protein [Chitinophagaceae bacterium]
MAKADTNLQIALDNKTYNQDDLFLVKIPINLPYQNNWTSFERVDGEVNFEGETYRFVQRKVENDTMYLQCIRHAEKTNIQQKANDFFGKPTDIASNNASKKTSPNQQTALKYFVEDFVSNDNQWQPLSFINTISYFSNPNTSNCSSHLQQLIRPPQA